MVTKEQIEQFFNKNININTDSDGLLSGALLETYAGCKISGFNNNDKIWIYEGFEDFIKDTVFVDTDVCDPDITSIGQHITALDEIHFNDLRNNLHHLNPNLEMIDTKRCMSDNYYKKFPMGTFHYLIYLLETYGVEISFPDFDQKVFYTSRDGLKKWISVGEILCRPDNLWESSFKYTPNVMHWLNLFSNYSPTMSKIKDFIQRGLNNQNKIVDGKSLCDWSKERQNDFFLSLGSKDGDGGFDDILDKSYNDGDELSLNFLHFNRSVRTILGLNEFSASENGWKEIQGQSLAYKISTPEEGKNIIETVNPWGYACTNSLNTPKRHNLKMNLFDFS